MKKKITMWLITIFSIYFFSFNLFAGGQHYFNGIDSNFFTGYIPIEKWTIQNYLMYYHGDKFKHDNTKDSNIDYDRLANVVRIIYNTDYNFLNGIFGQQLYLNFQYQHLGNDTETDYGYGDIVYSPFLVSWHKRFSENKELHYYFSTDIYIPLGLHDNKDLLNAGKNFWTFEPVFAFTYLTSKWNISAKFMYDFNGKNDEYYDYTKMKNIDYDYGNEFHVDYALGYRLTDYFTAGLVGYYYKQITKDELDNQKLSEKAKIVGIGIGVHYKKNKTDISLSSIHEISKNAYQGQNIVLKISFLF